MKKKLTLFMAFLLIISAMVFPGCEKSKSNSELFKDAASSLMNLLSSSSPVKMPEMSEKRDGIDTNFSLTLNELSAEGMPMEITPLTIGGAYKGSLSDLNSATILHANLSTGEEKLNTDIYMPNGISSETLYVALPELLDKYISMDMETDSENLDMESLDVLQQFYADISNGKLFEKISDVIAPYITDEAIAKEDAQKLTENENEYTDLTKLTLTLKGEQLEEIGQKLEELIKEYAPENTDSSASDDSDTAEQTDDTDDSSESSDTAAGEDKAETPDMTITLYTQKGTALKAEIKISDGETTVNCNAFIEKTDEATVIHYYYDVDTADVNIAVTVDASLKGTEFEETLDLTVTPKEKADDDEDKTDSALKAAGTPAVQASSADTDTEDPLYPDMDDYTANSFMAFTKAQLKAEFKGTVEEGKITGEGNISAAADMSGVNASINIPFEATISASEDSYSFTISVDTSIMGVDIDAEMEMTCKFIENYTPEIPELNDDNTFDIEGENAGEELGTIMQKLQENYPTLYALLSSFTFTPSAEPDYPDYYETVVVLTNKDYSVTYTLYTENDGYVQTTVPLEVVIEENDDITLTAPDGNTVTFTPPGLNDETVNIGGFEFYNESYSEDMLLLLSSDYTVRYTIVPQMGSAYASVQEEFYCEYDENNETVTFIFSDGSARTVTQDEENENIYYIDGEKFIAIDDDSVIPE